MCYQSGYQSLSVNLLWLFLNVIIYNKLNYYLKVLFSSFSSSSSSSSYYYCCCCCCCYYYCCCCCCCCLTHNKNSSITSCLINMSRTFFNSIVVNLFYRRQSQLHNYERPWYQRAPSGHRPRCHSLSNQNSTFLHQRHLLRHIRHLYRCILGGGRHQHVGRTLHIRRLELRQESGHRVGLPGFSNSGRGSPHSQSRVRRVQTPPIHPRTLPAQSGTRNHTRVGKNSYRPHRSIRRLKNNNLKCVCLFRISFDNYCKLFFCLVYFVLSYFVVF